MLHRKYFGGRHQRGLVTVLDHNGRGLQGHNGLAAAHVALQQAVHRRALLKVRGDFTQRAFLRTRRLEGQYALDRFTNGRFAHAEGDARLPLRRFLAHGHAQLIEEKFLKDQPQVRRRAKRIQRLDRFGGRRKMHETAARHAAREIYSVPKSRQAADRAACR